MLSSARGSQQKVSYLRLYFKLCKPSVFPLLKALILTISFSALVACSGSSSDGGSDASDTTAPTVTVTPANNATHISVNPGISLSFSETVTAVTTDNVLLSKSNDGSNPIALTVSGSGASYTFTPSASLDESTEYFIIIKATSIKDVANNPLGSANQIISFRTYKQTLSFSAWVGTNDTLLDINDSLPSSSELYSYRGTNYNDCDIANITACIDGEALVSNSSATTAISNSAHTLVNTAFYKLKEGSLVSINSSENTTRFSKRDRHQAVWFKNKLWLIGGRESSSSSSHRNDVWSSPDGVNWTQEKAHKTNPAASDNQFSPRASHQVVAANIDGAEKLWLIGGDGSSGYKNDVWSSEDGVSWTQSTIIGSHFSARAYHQVVAANIDGTEKLWLIGGHDGSRKSDVWSSSDGVNWTQSSISGSHFSGRNSHQVVAANIDGTERLWLIGGNAAGFQNDVWSSSNGSNWSESTISGSHFSAHSSHQVVVANIDGIKKLWLIGGYDGDSYKDDVWSSSDGVNWTQSSISGSHFSARYTHQVVVANIGSSERLYVIGGYGGNYKNDVWRSANGSNWRKAYSGEITRP